MHTDSDGYTWGDRGDPIGEVILYTNGSLMVFTPEGYQMPIYQQSNLGMGLLRELAEEGDTFSISKFREWYHPISREEFKALAGINEE
jgi:hypothetical protein